MLSIIFFLGGEEEADLFFCFFAEMGVLKEKIQRFFFTPQMEFHKNQAPKLPLFETCDVSNENRIRLIHKV